jgi:hypothetical protein
VLNYKKQVWEIDFTFLPPPKDKKEEDEYPDDWNYLPKGLINTIKEMEQVDQKVRRQLETIGFHLLKGFTLFALILIWGSKIWDSIRTLISCTKSLLC